MDRFFSKLDLRDIKIDPFKASYPPDADESVEAGTDYGVEADVAPRPFGGSRQPHTPAWAAPVEAVSVNGYVDEEETYPNPNGAYAPDGAYAADTAATVVTQRNGDVLKVSARSRPSAVAGAIAGVVRENGRAEVQAIGAGATNQAVKAVAIARDYLRETGIEAICLPAFIDVTIENEDRTAIRLVVEPR